VPQVRLKTNLPLPSGGHFLAHFRPLLDGSGGTTGTLRLKFMETSDARSPAVSALKPCRRFAIAVHGEQQFEAASSSSPATRRLQIAGTGSGQISPPIFLPQIFLPKFLSHNQESGSRPALTAFSIALRPSGWQQLRDAA